MPSSVASAVRPSGPPLRTRPAGAGGPALAREACGVGEGALAHGRMRRLDGDEELVGQPDHRRRTGTARDNEVALDLAPHAGCLPGAPLVADGLAHVLVELVDGDEAVAVAVRLAGL